MTADHDVTDLLSDIQAGDHDAVDRLLPLVYDELRRLAHGALRGERADHTLGTTGLIHEAYLRLVDQTRTTWSGRAHFLGIAALAMRRTLVDYARRQKSLKRGGERRPVPIEDVVLLADQRADSILELDDALSRLAGLNERLARVVECRFFGGLTVEETAEALQVATRTVERDWQKARLWLYDQLLE
ncbi:sigma-70 family RNA polymerase sigma factor [soil metagenome]